MNRLQEIAPACTICFSGHRPARLPGGGCSASQKMQQLTAVLQQALIAEIEQGKTTMLHDVGIKIAGQYRPGIYYERNRMLIERSSGLLCYWDGESGGTKYTIAKAKEKGLHIHNLC